MPRLSVDIDVYFIPNVNRNELEADREKVSRIIKEFMQEEGYTLVPASRYSFSLDALYFQYQNTGGNRDVLKIEINYSLREHIFSLTRRKILTDVFDDNFDVLTVAPMEIFAAKANALMSRAAARDLYDFNNMIDFGIFDESEQEMLKNLLSFTIRFPVRVLTVPLILPLLTDCPLIKYGAICFRFYEKKSISI